MIVLDASAAIEWLLGRQGAGAVESAIRDPGQEVHVPHLWSVEVTQVLRRFVAAGTMPRADADARVEIVRTVPAVRYAHEPLLGRAWRLRANLTVYDAVYVALSEALAAPLLTADRRLAAAPGHTAEVRIVPTAG